MSFVFTSRPLFEWPVTICVPNGGSFTEIVITGEFEMGDEEEFHAVNSDATKVSEAIDFEIAKMMGVFNGWADGDIVDDQGKPWPATPENIEAFLRKRPNRIAVTKAYTDATNPTKGHRAKN